MFIYTVKNMNNQRGGTILGLMIGVVLGLAAALAVAVFVTKTPSPFNNKMQNHSVETDATESKKNKDWDPNAALSGKNPAKPTPPVVPGAVVSPVSPVTPSSLPATSTTAVSATTAAKPSVASNANANAAPAMPPEKPAKPAIAGTTSPVSATPPVVAGSLSPSVITPKPATKPGADPISDLMRSKAEPKPTTSATEPFMYFVQAGAFRTPEDAEAQRARLSLQGIDTKVTEREQAGRTVYRVRSGPFNKEEDADRVKDKLSATGSDAALVRVQR
jgi:cell division protein FtsN